MMTKLEQAARAHREAVADLARLDGEAAMLSQQAESILNDRRAVIQRIEAAKQRFVETRGDLLREIPVELLGEVSVGQESGPSEREMREPRS